MPISALPVYLQKADFSDASPGFRFSTLLDIWKSPGISTGGWTIEPESYNALCKIKAKDQDCMNSLVQRQNVLHKTLQGPEVLMLQAESVAPFSTGLGSEHPLENGFAFLSPYGLPYLPASGVKGVIRRAAQELSEGVWEESCGWSCENTLSIQNGLSVHDLLFGTGTSLDDEESFHGVLSFWDVIPQLSNGQMSVEIMAPHQKHYYQDKKEPHEGADPTPIFFLSVPPGSGFTFYVVCDQERLTKLSPDLAYHDDWKNLLTAAFQHAFDWLGFGAKTATGYGRMRVDPKIEEERRKERQQREAEQKRLLEQEQEEERRRKEQAKYDALPKSHRMLLEAEKSFKESKSQNHYVSWLDKANQQAKRLINDAPGWSDEDAREKAAALLEEHYESAGWHERGKKRNKKQKQKQEKNRRDGIARIRKGVGKCTD